MTKAAFVVEILTDLLNVENHELKIDGHGGVAIFEKSQNRHIADEMLDTAEMTDDSKLRFSAGNDSCSEHFTITVAAVYDAICTAVETGATHGLVLQDVWWPDLMYTLTLVPAPEPVDLVAAVGIKERMRAVK